MYGLRKLADVRVQRAALLAVAIVLVAYRLLQLVAVPAARWGYDFVYYWRAGRAILDGTPIYSAQQLAGPFAPQGQEGFLYPPPVAALVAPLSAIFPTDFVPAAIVWSTIGAVLAGAVLLKLAETERLAERYPLLEGRWVWLILVAAFSLPPVIDEFINGNVHLYLVALLGLAWLGLKRGSAYGDLVGGSAIGVATMIKVFPALLILWMTLTARRRAPFWSLLAMLLLAAFTLPFTHFGPWLEYPRVLANLSAPTDTTAAFAPTIWLAPLLGFEAARVVVTVAGLAVMVWSIFRNNDRTAFAVAVSLAVLITPALWSHYLTVLLVPLLLALAGGVAPAWLAVVYVLLSAGNQAALGDLAWITIRAMPTAGALLLVGLLVAKRRPGSRAPRQPLASERPW